MPKKHKGITKMPNCLPFSEVKRILEALGAKLVREGNHPVFIREVNRCNHIIPVPKPSGGDIPQGTLHRIWRLAKASKSEVMQAYAGVIKVPKTSRRLTTSTTNDNRCF